ncbi:MAG: DUF7553 family protein [Haloferacaceae archaeon]
MTRTELAAAGDLLAAAAEDADSADVRETLSGLAEQLDRLADADRGPDHGRLARIESKLDDVRRGESDDVATVIDEALDEIHAYRETLQGV